jgi:hypothetical protein
MQQLPAGMGKVHLDELKDLILQRLLRGRRREAFILDIIANHNKPSQHNYVSLISDMLLW